MAVVYLARDLRHVRDVAVKIFQLESEEPGEGSQRFLQEIQIAARLSHPNILPLHDSGEAEGLLYYVMPYVPGETLRQRLDREGALPVPDALRIAAEVADALAYAHSHGVIHRDIKPENILFISDHAVVADFGIARAISAGGWEEWKLAGPAGTPTYMSPEQARGGSRVDGRSDVYSLGCVLYEMLTGEPPFRGSTPEEVVVQHLESEPLPVHTRRPALTRELEVAVGKALAKHPADRYQTAQQMADALARLQAGHGALDDTGGSLRQGAAATPSSGSWVRRWAGPGMAAIGIAAATVWTMAARSTRLDASLVYVGPLIHREGVPADFGSEQCSRLIYDAVNQWQDLRVVDRFWAQDQLARVDGTPTLDDLLAIARRVRAGRLLSGEVYTWGDSVKVRGVLYDVAHGPDPVRQKTVVIPRGDLALAEQRLGELADSLMLPEPHEAAAVPGITGTRRIDAWQAYDSAHGDLASWDLEAAAAGFRTALTRDPQYALAHLWLAQTLNWMGEDPSSWRDEVAAALEPGSGLPGSERAWGQALLALAEGRYQDACGQYDAMVKRDTLDFQGWYGRGECRRMDRVVLRDASSASGWRFRSSYEAAIRDYQKALRLVPSVHRAFKGAAFARLVHLFFAEVAVVRTGVAPSPDTAQIVGVASLKGDTVAFTAYTFEQVRDPKRAQGLAGPLAVTARNRRLLREVTSGWVQAFPRSPDALEAQGMALELAGELASHPTVTDSALAQLVAARSLAPTGADSIRIAASEIRVLMKLGRFGEVNALVDSLLRRSDTADPSSIWTLAGLSALVGRPSLSAHLLQRVASDREVWDGNGRPIPIPLPLRQSAAALEAFTALGAPSDSVSAVVSRILRQVRTLVPGPDRDRATRAILARPLALAGISYVPSSLGSALTGADYLLDLELALKAADTSAVREGLRRIATLRSGARPGDVALEVTLQEAILQLALGDSIGATQKLDAALQSLPTFGSDLVSRPDQAGAIVRTMKLRAELASRQGQRETAVRWTAPVLTLWASAEPSLRQQVDELRRLTQSN